MANYSFKISVSAQSPEEAKKLGTLIQQVVLTQKNEDVIKLLDKCVKSPSVVKTALKFI